MYTEDDDKVVVNKDPKDEYANFYTSFINDEKEKKKNKNIKEKKKPKVEVKKEEEDYSNFYSSFMESEKIKKESTNAKKETPKEKVKEKKVTKEKEESYELTDEEDYSEFYSNDKKIKNTENRNNIFKIILFAIGLIAFVGLLFFLLSKLKPFDNKEEADIILTNEVMDIRVGEKNAISYQIVNTDLEVTSTFTSSNEDIVIVDKNGLVTGISSGEAEIIISYTIDGKTKEKKCIIKVSGEGSIDKNISLNVKIENGTENVWSNKNIVIQATAKSIYGVTSLKYAINCEDNNCEYKNVQDNKITISNNGISKVQIVAKDNNNQQTQKFLTIKIDKDAPTITFNEKTNITSSSDVTVCATCNDNVSGCKQEKVCKKFTSSKSNQKLIIEDLAGNQTYSPSFNVKINKVTSPCSLSVSKDGTVTGSFKDGATYYGFDSNYSGSNVRSKKIDINATKAGETKAKIIYYYVKDSKGEKHSCYITVIKECVCSNNKTESNCPVTCTFKVG